MQISVVRFQHQHRKRRDAGREFHVVPLRTVASGFGPQGFSGSSGERAGVLAVAGDDGLLLLRRGARGFGPDVQCGNGYEAGEFRVVRGSVCGHEAAHAVANDDDARGIDAEASGVRWIAQVSEHLGPVFGGVSE